MGSSEERWLGSSKRTGFNRSGENVEEVFVKWLALIAVLVVVGGCSSQNAPATSSGSVATSGGLSGPTSGGTSTGTASGGSTSGGSSGSSGAGSTTGRSGFCSPPCGHDATCDAGACSCIAGASNCPLEDGGLNCVDENSDDSNCGSCASICPVEATCTKGICDCDAGPACVTDAGLACFALGDDFYNCGSCGYVCPDIASNCSDGSCQCSGRPGRTTPCLSEDAGYDICVDTSTDPGNCGTCGNDCGTSYASGADCFVGFCACRASFPPVSEQLCATIPSGSPPACVCTPLGTSCSNPSFGRDIYPLLAQTNGSFGCSASGCHSGAQPAGGS